MKEGTTEMFHNLEMCPEPTLEQVSSEGAAGCLRMSGLSNTLGPSKPRQSTVPADDNHTDMSATIQETNPVDTQ